MGRGTQEIHLEAGRLHLRAALYQPPELRDQGVPRHRDEQPHHQGYGLRLARPVGECAGVLKKDCRMRLASLALATAAFALAATSIAQAQTADFYKGKNIDLMI